MKIEEIKDSLLKNNFTGLRVKLDTVIEFIDEQQAEIEVLKQQLVTTSSEAKLNYNKGHEEGCSLAVVKELTGDVKDALMDALSGWKYIRQCHGDLYGVGWDRVQEKLEAILRKAQ